MNPEKESSKTNEKKEKSYRPIKKKEHVTLAEIPEHSVSEELEALLIKKADASNFMKYCINCGTKILPNSKYCHKCGKELTYPSEQEIANESKDTILFVDNDKNDNDGIKNHTGETIIEEEDSNKNVKLDKSDSADTTEKTKKSSFMKFIRLAFVIVSFFLISASINALVGYIFFPRYIGNEIITPAIMMLAAGVVVRYLTLLRFNNKQRIISLLKNISIVSLIVSVQGYLLPAGMILIGVFFILVLIFDRLSENSYIEKIFNKEKKLKVIELFILTLLLIAIVFSTSAGRNNLSINNALELIENEESKKNSINVDGTNELTYLKDNGENINLTIIKKLEVPMGIYLNEDSLLNRRLVQHSSPGTMRANKVYFGDADMEKTTIMRIQSNLKELGYYKGYIDGVNGKITKDAITNYKRDNYTDNESTIDEHITLKLIKKLEIEEP